MLVAGIDEAGLGPVLGPLVVSAVAMEVPDDAADRSLWELLAAAVSRKPARHRTKIAIGDSKKLYSRQRKSPLEHLERAVLAALGAAGRRPKSLKGLLKVLCPAVVKDLASYPWYAGGDVAVPVCLTTSQAGLAANALSTAMAEVGVGLLAVRSEVVPVGEYNRLVAATRNKSAALNDVTSRLLAYLWGKLPARPLRIDVDRQGARRSYLRGLQQLWPQAQFKVLDESDSFSAYRISEGALTAEIRYAVKSEELSLPVALASMICKYVRELMMEMFNRFWTAHVPGLEPTAGYYVDGRRFFREISGPMGQLGVDKEIVYRSR